MTEGIKGAGIREFMKWFGEAHGRDAVRAALDHMPPEHRNVFVLDDPYVGIVTSAWYPIAPMHALMDGLAAVLGDDRARQEALRAGAHATLDATLHGVYRWLFQTMMSPERYAKNAQKLFSRYYSQGEMLKRVESPTSHLTIVRDWPAHHPMLCDMLRYTGEFVYAALGCRDVVVDRGTCISRGGTECAFRTTWRSPT